MRHEQGPHRQERRRRAAAPPHNAASQLFGSAWLTAKTAMAGKVLAESVAVVPGIQGREVAQKWCSSRGGGGHATPTAEAAATMECNGRRH